MMETNTKASIPDDQLLRIQDVAGLTTLSKSCINLWVAQGRFPKPIALSKTVKLWSIKSIRAWIRKKQFDQSQNVSDSDSKSILECCNDK
jgi:prophage regulatory protein